MNDYLSKSIEAAALLAKLHQVAEKSPDGEDHSASIGEFDPAGSIRSEPTLDAASITVLRDAMSPEEARNFLAMYIAEADKAVARIAERAEAGRFDEVAVEAHSMISMAATVGALQFSATARLLDDAATAADATAVRLVIQKLKDAAESAREALNTISL